VLAVRLPAEDITDAVVVAVVDVYLHEEIHVLFALQECVATQVGDVPDGVGVRGLVQQRSRAEVFDLPVAVGPHVFVLVELPGAQGGHVDDGRADGIFADLRCRHRIADPARGTGRLGVAVAVGRGQVRVVAEVRDGQVVEGRLVSVGEESGLAADVAGGVEARGPDGDPLSRGVLEEGSRRLRRLALDHDARLAVLNDERQGARGPGFVDLEGVAAVVVAGDVVEHLAVDVKAAEVIHVRKRFIA